MNKIVEILPTDSELEELTAELNEHDEEAQLKAAQERMRRAKAELLATEAEVARLTELKRDKALDEIVQRLKANGLTPDDVAEHWDTTFNAWAISQPIKATRVKPYSTGKKAPIKFRDPATGKEWSGRGSLPKWLTVHEGAGGSRDDFRI